MNGNIKKNKRAMLRAASVLIACLIAFALASCGGGSGGGTTDGGDGGGTTGGGTGGDGQYWTGLLNIAYWTIPSFGPKDELVKREIWMTRDEIGIREYPVYGADGEEYDRFEGTATRDVSAAMPDDAFWDIAAMILDGGYEVLPYDIETGVMDGDYAWILAAGTGEEEDPSSLKGGLGAATDGPEAFTRVCRAIESLAESVDFEAAEAAQDAVSEQAAASEAALYAENIKLAEALVYPGSEPDVDWSDSASLSYKTEAGFREVVAWYKNLWTRLAPDIQPDDFMEMVDEPDYYRYYGTYRGRDFTLSVRDMEGSPWGDCDYSISFAAPE